MILRHQSLRPRPRTRRHLLGSVVLTVAIAQLAGVRVAIGQTSSPRWSELLGPDAVGEGGVYDVRRDRVVRLLEGRGVFERSVMGWIEIPVTAAPPNAPIQRRGFAAAYDPVRGRVVMFSGVALQPLSDTWAWDGLEWRRLASLVTPPRRVGGAMAFDPLRGDMVLCGGADPLGSPRIEDTWLLRGDQWRQFTGAVPPYGPTPVMTFDAARSEVVLAGVGAHHFDGTAWRTSNPQVAALGSGAIAYDPLRRMVVLHRPGRDLLEYDGLTWANRPVIVPTNTRVSMRFDPRAGALELAEVTGRGCWHWDGATVSACPLTEPLVTSASASFVDSLRGRLVVAGGGLTTWELTGKVWQPRVTATNPPRFFAEPSTFDSARGVGICYSQSGGFWSYDGNDWGRLPAGPAQRQFAHLAFDAARGRVVFTGGINGTVQLGDLWEWDGVAWAQRLSNGPHVGVFGAMAYDPLRARSVVVDSAVTREWDGTQWSTTTTAPQANALAAMTFEPSRGRIVCVTSNALHDYDGVAWRVVMNHSMVVLPGSELHVHPQHGNLLLVLAGHVLALQTHDAEIESVGVPCGEPSPVLQVNRPPVIGDTAFVVQAATRPAAPTWFAFSTAATSQPLGSGCSLLVAAPWVVRFELAGAAGLASTPLPIAASPSLLGQQFFVQAAAGDSGAPLGFVLTQALRMRIGG